MIPLQNWLFPKQHRRFNGLRWARIILRTLHIIGVVGLGGGILFHLPENTWYPYLLLTSFTGICLILLELWTNAVWLFQLGGLAILSKLGLFFLLLHFHYYEQFLLISILIISGIISHAPAIVRHYSLWHGKPIDYLPIHDEKSLVPDKKG
ncbi:hypothetical protein [Beggiatoa leptomitoformis]|uniref:Uncharacterized protein n=1 Tax=Beggiatoa leptomitoformis TaxID=288004 RepID=A0A2N9YIZ0_9GAMM|nr:hypothetical protein [Beggiatoa leptomitoformis]ALG67336.1 hypothetical protein AL038_05980 [Beggiatoa leptomitoformis]AUI70464.1 hypothetical protein BLE401_18340 [Beggiatoa leptomitoformis]